MKVVWKSSTALAILVQFLLFAKPEKKKKPRISAGLLFTY
jgi:hypothetical protein